MDFKKINKKINSRSTPLLRVPKLLGAKRSQITIFVIVALLIVAIVFVYFFWVKPTYLSGEAKRPGFEGCMADVVENSLDNLGRQAGFDDPKFYYTYKNDHIGYLCYTNLYYKTCVVQKPFIEQHFEEQLTMASRKGINDCYKNSIDDLKQQGFNVVSSDNPNLSIKILPDVIEISLDAPISVSGEGSQKFNKFKSDLASPLYDMLMVSTSILQSEARNGDSDVWILMQFYPDLIIDKIKRGDEATIYILENKNTGTKFQFASRSLAWPAGYGTGTGLV